MEPGRPLFGDPQPNEVLGYREAVAAGRVPSVPAEPPLALPGRSAAQLRTWMLAAVVAWMASSAATIVGLSGAAEDVQGVGAVGVLLLGSAAMLALMRLAKAVGHRHYSELQRGYSTVEAIYALWEPTRDGRFAKLDWNVPWDHRGCWILRSDGRVVRGPDRRVEPPGFYPSPHRAELFELWTGRAWAGVYSTTPQAGPDIA